MAEVSEQPQEAPVEQEPSQEVAQQQTEEQPVEEELPVVDEQEPEPEEPVDVSDTPPEQLEEEPQQLKELSVILDMLIRIQRNCERTRIEIDYHDRSYTQSVLQDYAHAMAYIPKVIQLLHDFRRFAPEYDARVAHLHKGFREARKDDTALSTEEERIIAAGASVRETLLSAIGGLEYALSHLRNTTKNLLALIAYADEDFFSYAEDNLKIINIGLIQGIAYEETSRIRSLKRDILELRSFEDHLAQLQPEQ